MNTPDDTMLKKWLDGELEGHELKEMELWAEEHADTLEQKMGWEPLGEALRQALPAEQEPPYAEFFNQRVKHHAVELEQVTPASVESLSSRLLRRLNWLMVPAAAAGMAVCFFLGQQLSTTDDQFAVGAIDDVYTPASSVTSEVIVSDSATLIVLDGLEDIPDEIEIVLLQQRPSSVERIQVASIAATPTAL